MKGRLIPCVRGVLCLIKIKTSFRNLLSNAQPGFQLPRLHLVSLSRCRFLFFSCRRSSQLASYSASEQWRPVRVASWRGCLHQRHHTATTMIRLSMPLFRFRSIQAIKFHSVRLIVALTQRFTGALAATTCTETLARFWLTVLWLNGWSKANMLNCTLESSVE